MPPTLGNAEKQRLYRLRRDSDPNRRAAYVSKKKEKYAKDCQLGKRMFINDMTEREKRIQRKVWKKNQQACRSNAKQARVQLTPPMSPADDQIIPIPTSQRSRGRRKVARTKAKCYRENKRLQQLLNQERRNIAKYRKRYERLMKIAQPKNQTGTPSPKSKTKHLLRNWWHNPKPVNRTLTFHYAMLVDIKAKYKMSKSEKYKHQFSWVFCGKLIKKYKLLSDNFHFL